MQISEDQSGGVAIRADLVIEREDRMDSLPALSQPTLDVILFGS